MVDTSKMEDLVYSFVAVRCEDGTNFVAHVDKLEGDDSVGASYRLEFSDDQTHFPKFATLIVNQRENKAHVKMHGQRSHQHEVVEFEKADILDSLKAHFLNEKPDFDITN